MFVAPHSSEILLAAKQAAADLGVECILVGDPQKIQADPSSAGMRIMGARHRRRHWHRHWR